MGRSLTRPRKPAAPDRAASLARSLVEGRIRLPIGGDGRLVPGSFRRYIDGAFPGISQDEVARGIAIAAEVVASDKGYPR